MEAPNKDALNWDASNWDAPNWDAPNWNDSEYKLVFFGGIGAGVGIERFEKELEREL